jgi:excisionase family DNA binding protein
VGALAILGKRSPTAAKVEGKTMTDTESEILTLDEVAAYLKAGKRTVYRFAQNGEIPAFKLGGTWRFRRSELDRWIAESINKKARGRVTAR